MTQAIDIISRALKDIGALEAGETPAPADAQDAFDMLNDMLDQWSNEQMMVFYKTEIIFTLTSRPDPVHHRPWGANRRDNYRINLRNDPNGHRCLLWRHRFGDDDYRLWGIERDQDCALWLWVPEVMSTRTAPIPSTSRRPLGSTTLSAYYERPLNINSAFVRINTNENGQPVLNGGLDYPITILNLENYELIGFKTLNGPWPRALYYQPSETLGTITVWPNPSQGEMHIFTDTIFQRFTSINDEIAIPQGYYMALRWCLAERLMPMYGKASPTQIQMINGFAGHAKATIKRTNMRPVQVARFRGHADCRQAGRCGLDS
jgi:hypothetical protein